MNRKITLTTQEKIVNMAKLGIVSTAGNYFHSFGKRHKQRADGLMRYTLCVFQDKARRHSSRYCFAFYILTNSGHSSGTTLDKADDCQSHRNHLILTKLERCIMESMENIVLEHLRAIRSDVGNIKADIAEVKLRLGSIEMSVGSIHTDIAILHSRADRLDGRVERIEKRLELVTA